MDESIDKISQISIYSKSETERINEIALIEPLKHVDHLKRSIFAQSWHHVPLLKRAALKVQTFLFQHASFMIPPERRVPEAIFKAILASVLIDEAFRDYFLATQERQNHFYAAAAYIAEHIGYTDFHPPSETMPRKIAEELTLITNRAKSLIDDPSELNLQLASINAFVKDELLFKLLDGIKRPPITSIIEVQTEENTATVPLTTRFARYKVESWDEQSGEILYSCNENETTASIRTIENIRPGARGVVNQRILIDDTTHDLIGAYGEELDTPPHLLEQILFILGEKSGKALLLKGPNADREVKILFTSLHSWHELSLISQQHEAIHALNGKVLQTANGELLRLNLLHFNVSCAKLPAPNEMGAKIKDLNDECLMRMLGEPAVMGEYFARQNALNKVIDHFRANRASYRDQLPDDLHPLLADKTQRGKDLLTYIDLAAAHFGYFHSKNSSIHLEKAIAFDKALCTFKKICQHPYLPAEASKEEHALIEVLYHLQLSLHTP